MSVSDIDAVDFSDPGQVKKVVTQLVEKVAEQEDKMDHLKKTNIFLVNEVDDLKKRMSVAERYSSRSCIVLHNVQLLQLSPEQAALKLMTEVLRMTISAADLHAVHQLPTNGQVPPIIVKFVYNRHRDQAWNRKKNLKGYHTNKYPYAVVIRERLPELDREIEKQARAKGLETITKRCQVHVVDGETTTAVNDISELDDFRGSKPAQRSSGLTSSGVQSSGARVILPHHYPASASNTIVIPDAQPATVQKTPATKRAFDNVRSPPTSVQEILNDNIVEMISLMKKLSPVAKQQKQDSIPIWNPFESLQTQNQPNNEAEWPAHQDNSNVHLASETPSLPATPGLSDSTVPTG